MKRTRLRPISKKRSAGLVKYKRSAGEYMKDHPMCEVCELRCSMDIHHKARRGKFLCDKKYFLSVCRDCHTRIENNPKWAMDKGYLVDKFNA